MIVLRCFEGYQVELPLTPGGDSSSNGGGSSRYKPGNGPAGKQARSASRPDSPGTLPGHEPHGGGAERVRYGGSRGRSIGGRGQANTWKGPKFTREKASRLSRPLKVFQLLHGSRSLGSGEPAGANPPHALPRAAVQELRRSRLRLSNGRAGSGHGCMRWRGRKGGMRA